MNKTLNKIGLIKKIKEKKELMGVTNSVVENALDEYLSKYKLDLNKISPSHERILVKEIRHNLRLLTGRYQKSIKRKDLGFDEKSIEKVLLTHSSTSERREFYPKLKELISNLNVKSILDLGCGLNPLALANKRYEYIASDIKEDELKLIQEYFKEKNISGKTFVYDLRNISSDLPKADLCIIFKVLDILSKTKKDRAMLAEKVLTLIKSEIFLISFSTKKLSGKKMNYPNRTWFEKILSKLNLSYEKIETSNEIFYLIKKN